MFEKGDIVQLKSGGPQMTVKAVNEQMVFCIWFEKKSSSSQSVQQHEFESFLLKKFQSSVGVIRTRR
ncbi:MAG: DUF2158 domain-containing protein [Pseudomonadota bacterium]